MKINVKGDGPIIDGGFQFDRYGVYPLDSKGFFFVYLDLCTVNYSWTGAFANNLSPFAKFSIKLKTIDRKNLILPSTTQLPNFPLDKVHMGLAMRLDFVYLLKLVF